MTTLEQIRYAYVWQSRTGVEERGREFDDWLTQERLEVWNDGYNAGYHGEA